MKKTFLLLTLSVGLSPAAVVYDNSSLDTFYSAFYSAGGFTQIGDRLRLSGATPVTSLDTQFYNAGGLTATFDATLRFFEIGLPVGNQIGSDFTVTGISIGSEASQTVTFANLGGLALPGNVIVMLSVSNVSNGGDIGVNFFDPPGVGSSSNAFFMTHDGTGFTETSTLSDVDNVYFVLRNDSTAVPEPGTVGMTCAALAALGWVKRRRR